jgi:hypothetical protein
VTSAATASEQAAGDRSDRRNGIASRVAGGAALLTGAGTAVGLAEGREWSAVAERAGLPFLLLLLLVWLAVKVGGWAAPYFRDAFHLHRDFVSSVKAVTEQQAATLERLADGHEALSARLDSVCSEQRETNRLLRAASSTPVPPGRSA